MEQLTTEQAIAFGESKAYKGMTDEQIVRFQLFQDKLCIPFSIFHEAMNSVLGRSVFTHEFANANLLKEEYLGVREAPTFEEIMDMIPESKRIIIGKSNQ